MWKLKWEDVAQNVHTDAHFCSGGIVVGDLTWMQMPVACHYAFGQFNASSNQARNKRCGVAPAGSHRPFGKAKWGNSDNTSEANKWKGNPKSLNVYMYWTFCLHRLTTLFANALGWNDIHNIRAILWSMSVLYREEMSRWILIHNSILCYNQTMMDYLGAKLLPGNIKGGGIL